MAQHRELGDPKALRAMAHPLRLSLLEHLAVLGPSTATELADHFEDQSPANCSWHLRQLAEHGFIEEAESGPGRQRRWRIVAESTSTNADPANVELTQAAMALDETLISRALEHRREWMAERGGADQRWRDAATSIHAWAWLTAAELDALTTELSDLVDKHILAVLDRLQPENRPPGSRPVQLIAWTAPRGPETADTPSSDDSDEEPENDDD
jgi:DNA-binding transcriptional ArsR family regulator